MSYLIAKKMRYFMVVMEIRNFAKAAEALCITRSPLSKVICELEDYLGGMLFKRKYNELEPTELAWKYYNKIRPVYVQLLAIENEIKSKHANTGMMIRFDTTFPKQLYKYIAMVIESSGIKAKCEHTVIEREDVDNVFYENNQLILSLRDIQFSDPVAHEEWLSDDLVLLSANEISAGTPLTLLIWQDASAHYMREVFAGLLKGDFGEIGFIEHDYDLISTLYSIRLGRGCGIMTEKISAMFNMESVKVKKLEGKKIKIHVYHKLSPEYSDNKESVRKALRSFI